MIVTTAPTFTLIDTVELGDGDTLIATAVMPTSETFGTFEQAHAYMVDTYGADIAGYLVEVDESNNLVLEDATTCEDADYSDEQAESFVDDLPSLGRDVTWLIRHCESSADVATATVH